MNKKTTRENDIFSTKNFISIIHGSKMLHTYIEINSSVKEILLHDSIYKRKITKLY